MAGLRRPGLGPQLLDPQQLRLPVHLALDRLEPGERVELGEQLLEGLRPAAPAPRLGLGLRLATVAAAPSCAGVRVLRRPAWTATTGGVTGT